MVWSEDGVPLQGLAAGDFRKIEFPLRPFKDSQHSRTYYIECAANGCFGAGADGQQIAPPDPNKRFLLKTAQLALFREEAHGLLMDLEVKLQFCRSYIFISALCIPDLCH